MSGLLSSKADSEPAVPLRDQPMAVEVDVLDINTMERKISLQGQMEPVRHLHLKAETSGAVEKIHVIKGTRVNKNAALVTLNLGGRQNALAEASARVRMAKSEQSAALSLRQKGLQSQLQLEQAEASLESALAQLGAVELDINNTTIRAPFDAIINNIPIELGELIDRGDLVAELIDDSQFNVSAQASQHALSSLKLGQNVSVQLITDQELFGKLTYISSIADPQTRSFTVEARIENTNDAVAAGVSATLHIPVEQVEATFLSPSSLSLGDAGEIGVKAVDDQNTVLFLPISIISTSLNGAWVTGIPPETRIITLGQGFVNAGELVEPKLKGSEDTIQNNNSPAKQSKP